MIDKLYKWISLIGIALIVVLSLFLKLYYDKYKEVNRQLEIYELVIKDYEDNSRMQLSAIESRDNELKRLRLMADEFVCEVNTMIAESNNEELKQWADTNYSKEIIWGAINRPIMIGVN